MTVRFLAAFAVLLPALLFVACGDDDDSPEPTTGPSQTAAGGGTPTAPAATVDATPAVEATATPGAFSGGTAPVTATAPAGLQPPTVQAMRAAAQPGFDRLVFEFSGDKVPGYTVEYSTKAVGCGSGEDLTDFIGGGKAPAAMLIVKMQPANAHNEAGQATVAKDLQPGLSTIVRVFRTCDFEADVQYAVALSGQKPFKVSTLTGPARLVIDIGQ